MRKATRNIIVLASICAVVLLLLSPTMGFHLLSIGYLTGTQGLQAQFNSVYWNGAWYSSTEKPTGSSPSSMSFGYSMAMNPDGARRIILLSVLVSNR